MSSQQARRNRRGSCQHGSLRARQLAVARQMGRDVGMATNPLDVERWASAFLGQLWVRRDRVGYDDGWAAILGGPIVEDLAASRGMGAKLALIALSRLDPGVFGVMCADLAEELGNLTLPAWTDQLGTAKVTRAAWDLPPESGELAVLGLRRAGAECHSLIIYTGPARGDPIRCLGVSGPFDHALQHFAPKPDELPLARLKPVEPAFICRRIEKAMRESDETSTDELEAGYAENRALVLAAVRQVDKAKTIRNGYSLDGSQIA